METSKITIPRVRITTGEILENGAIIDLVAAKDHDGLDLLLWDGQKALIAPAIDHGLGWHTGRNHFSGSAVFDRAQ